MSVKKLNKCYWKEEEEDHCWKGTEGNAQGTHKYMLVMRMMSGFQALAFM